METTSEFTAMSRARIPYPWFSLLLGLLIIVWQLVLARPQWIHPHALPDTLLKTELLISAVLLWVVLVGLEIIRFYKAWTAYKAHIAELFDSRRKLGTRVRTYSDHADKLKMFISDKLLEYIEYDEKFLHFKNIASEVRHNGVISYDKTQTALKQAAEICADRMPDDSQGKQFEEAADSLLYLWDLLDIATTDNITLHVANRIYDSEEYYFQSMLNKSDASDFPYDPTFSMFSALKRALQPIVDNPQEINWADVSGFPLSYRDEQFHVLVKGDSDMLGNRNHMVLLLENLLNNAVYYADQKGSKKNSSRVTILLAKQQDQVFLEVYNRGPRIKEEDRKRIFQLGYSSRRIRDHHGKGLGLYFVNEICKGFEGSVDFENVENQDRGLSLRIELTNGEVENHFVNIIEDNGKPLCLLDQMDGIPTRSMQWSFSQPITSIEVSSKDNAEPQLITNLSGKESVSQPDTSDSLLPRWNMEITNRKRSSKLSFRPLDIRGVKFRVKLPTALSRLENQEIELDGIKNV